MRRITNLTVLILLLLDGGFVLGQPSEQQLARWLERYPEADANGDGRLTVEEAEAYRQNLVRPQGTADREGRIDAGAPPEPKIDPGWQRDRFPDHAVCYRSPREIATTYAKCLKGQRDPVTSYSKPADGSLRIVGTGHSFMAPGYQSFPAIARAAGLNQPPLVTHTGGGITGSARYKWEEENGIFQFDGHPTPKLLASIANAEWDAMMWGPYYHDRPAYYTCWIDFCLKYNPQMKFYLMNGWPQLGQLGGVPDSEDALTAETINRMGEIRKESYAGIVRTLNEKYGDKVFILPTCDAMVLAVQHYRRGELPGVEGIHSLVGKKERSMWRDMIGHLGPGFDRLEGYVFYATLYGRSLLASRAAAQPAVPIRGATARIPSPRAAILSASLAVVPRQIRGRRIIMQKPAVERGCDRWTMCFRLRQRPRWAARHRGRGFLSATHAVANFPQQAPQTLQVFTLYLQLILFDRAAGAAGSLELTQQSRQIVLVRR